MKIVISNTVNMPIYEQIVNQIRDAVINGELKAGEGMPSIRVLAKELTVSVITTKRAYEELEKEGVIESVPGRGFYVCEQKNDHLREKQMMNIEKRMSDILKDCENILLYNKLADNITSPKHTISADVFPLIYSIHPNGNTKMIINHTYTAKNLYLCAFLISSFLCSLVYGAIYI